VTTQQTITYLDIWICSVLVIMDVLISRNLIESRVVRIGIGGSLKEPGILRVWRS
jgi:hypothetical protein